MFKERLNPAELRTITMLSEGPLSMAQLAKAIGSTLSWASRCIKHIEGLGLVQVMPDGRSTRARISNTDLGNHLLAFLNEPSILKPELLLAGQSLKMLPLLVNEGTSAREISMRTHLSARTVQSYLGRWRAGGIVNLKNWKYVLNPRHVHFKAFVQVYSKHRNLARLAEVAPDAAIIWHDRDEFIVSINHPLAAPGFAEAADTALDKYHLDLVHANEYYHFSPISHRTSKVDALLQSLMVDPTEPRIHRLIRKELSSGHIRPSDLRAGAMKYKIGDAVEKVMKNAG